MTTTFKHVALAALAGTMLASAASASDLRAFPTTLEPLAGSRTTSLTVINEESRPLRVQVRVMRWSQVNGVETLAPTRDVVASPPFATLAPHQHSLVRVVRTASAAPVGEESYRVLIDEVPDAREARPGSVNLVLRQSIPAFFSDVPRRTSIVDWSLDRHDAQLSLVATNRGDRRLRLSDMALEGHGVTVYHQAGLIGYVLPGATMRWPIAADPAIPRGASLALRAVSDTGELEVPLVETPGV